MDSPVEGGFDLHDRSASAPSPSTAMLKRHIKELYEKLHRAEVDKHKIADQALFRVKNMAKEYEAQIEDARLSQMKQAELVDKLRVSVYYLYLLSVYESFPLCNRRALFL